MPDLTAVPPPEPDQPEEHAASPAPQTTPQPPVVSWTDFVRNATNDQVEERFAKEAAQILSDPVGSQYCCLALLEPDDNIAQFDLDRIYQSLSRLNTNKDKDVLLILLSRGGSIEPAYQISKICKSFAKSRFIVAVPRQAKSAATLIALGADEIHMSVLGQLGPIDPQLGGLPALGVSQALETIAGLTERHPGSAEMFARYLRLALTVEQIGYYERVCESAEQYASRLLSTKPQLAAKAGEIAHELVHTYKDHGFVIDLAEAQQHLGQGWITTDTPEVALAEKLYELFYTVNLFLFGHKKRLLVLGSFDEDIYIFDRKA